MQFTTTVAQLVAQYAEPKFLVCLGNQLATLL